MQLKQINLMRTTPVIRKVTEIDQITSGTFSGLWYPVLVKVANFPKFYPVLAHLPELGDSESWGCWFFSQGGVMVYYICGHIEGFKKLF